VRIQHYQPAAALQPDFICFWTLEYGSTPIDRIPILPDAHVDLIVNCGPPQMVELDDRGCEPLPPVMLNGLQRKPIRMLLQEGYQLVAVQLHAWAVASLFDVTIGAYPQPLTSPAWLDIARLIKRTARRSGLAGAAMELQQVILDTRQRVPSAYAIQAACERLLATDGGLHIRQLAADCHLSESQFERQFKVRTGVSPKTYARLVRFESVRQSLQDNPRRNLAAVAQEFGYSDQAHLAHEFKTFSGHTPSDFTTWARGPR
jgi:AraC-like DNA-binding protein